MGRTSVNIQKNTSWLWISGWIRKYVILFSYNSLSNNFKIWEEVPTHITRKFDCAGDHHKFNPQYQTQPPGQNPSGGPYPGCGWGGPPEKGPRNCHAPPRQQDNIAMIRVGGFGLTDFDNMSAYYYFRTWQNDTGEKTAHRKFVLDAINSTLMEGANEACVACHTKVGVNITWTKNEYLEFTVIEDEAGNWTIPSFTAGGENVTQVNSSNEWTKPYVLFFGMKIHFQGQEFP